MMPHNDAAGLPEYLRLYIKLNLPVIPIHSIRMIKGVPHCSCGKVTCDSKGKHPRTKRGVKDATTDIGTIKGWVEAFPDCNWAVRTGNGIMVVDVDDVTQLDNIDLPETVMAITGGGGYHYWYRVSTDIPNSVSLLAEGVDVRGENGYVLVPPSTHASGRQYEWDLGLHPDDTPMAAAPETLVQQACSRMSKVTGATEGNNVIFVKKTRNNQLTRMAGQLRRIGMSYHGIRSALLDVNARQCSPPLDEKEVDKISRGIERYEPDEVGGWEDGLSRDSKKNITPEPGNAVIILTNHPEWKGCLGYNEFSGRIVWVKCPPSVDGFSSILENTDAVDGDYLYIKQWMRKNKSVSFSKQSVQDAMAEAARANTYNPLIEYLADLEWDRKQRVDTWLTDYLGARNTAYHNMVGRWWLISAIARAMAPGCQVDHLLVLEGPQGIGKSTAMEALCGKGWFLGSLPDIRNKDAYISLQGHWVVEIAELDALKGASATRVKDFVSQRVDDFREPYGRLSVKRPRRAVFVGTTNEQTYLTDATGARRFWPVKCGYIKRDNIIRDRDQIWAEAKYLFEKKEEWWPTREALPVLEDEQDERYVTDEWEQLIANYLKDRDVVDMKDVLYNALCLDRAHWDKQAQSRAGKCLYRLGYKKKRVRVDDLRVYRYVK